MGSVLGYPLYRDNRRKHIQQIKLANKFCSGFLSLEAISVHIGLLGVTIMLT